MIELSTTRENEKLLVSGLQEISVSLEDIQLAYNQVSNAIRPDVSVLNIELKNISSTNYHVLALLKSYGELCAKRKIELTFSNPDENVLKALTKLGFDDQGNYLREKKDKDKAEPVFLTVGEAVYKIISDTKTLISFFDDLVRTFFHFLRYPRKINWREMLYYMDKTGADAVPIVVMICFLVGVILSYQGLTELKRFGLTIYIADLVGLALVRELGPLMVAMICTGRAGSAFAAELGTMKVNEELDAMQTMGLKPSYMLVIPKIFGLMFVMPLLTIIGDFMGIAGGGIITACTSKLTWTEYINRVTEIVVPANVLESVTKGVVFAFLIAAIGCFRGFQASNDAKGVGNAATSAVVSGIFLVILADTAVTFVFPQVMHLFGVNY